MERLPGGRLGREGGSSLSKIPCRVPFFGLHGPAIGFELSLPPEVLISASRPKIPLWLLELLSDAMRSRQVVRQPPNAFQVPIGKLKTHQVPPMLSTAIPQKRFEKLIDGAAPPTAQAIFPPQFRPGQPSELVQAILGPLQCLCGFAYPVVSVSGFGNSNPLPDLPKALPAETRLVSQLSIRLRPIHFGPLGQESFALELPSHDCLR